MHDQMYYPYNLSQPMHVDMDTRRRWKPNIEMAPSCPRCDSSNTKFCYYNNYCLTQPRYFCKGCRRYWTKGGSLRNVPVGGGCRKSRRAKSSSTRLPSTSSVVKRPSTDNSAIRPDLALDDMVGASHHSIGRFSDDASSTTTTTDGSSIDLAVLYSKFLNQTQQQQPKGDHGLVDVSDGGGDAGDLIGSSSSSDQVGLIGDFDYHFDIPSCSYESLGLPEVQQGDVFFSMNPTSHVLGWQAPPEHLQQPGFCPVPDVFGMSHHHHQDLMGADWCPPSIDQSSFGAL